MSPIISISINESLKQFINKLVSKNRYENKSKLIRDALLRLMSDIEVSNFESFGDISSIEKSIIGNLIVIAPHDPIVQRKLNKIENKYMEQIVNKNQHFQGENLIMSIIFDGNISDFQNIVVDINGIKEIKNFRYLIVN
ncbi:MAG TPA: type II toxin-antitoxin system ParD family antitoxin [Candidatus Nanopelagicaceae bacterium]|nr:type II toxin-antitoxin system ParD family antitoxin [Candidatus Nanopelagicaceae bacterium]